MGLLAVDLVRSWPPLKPRDPITDRPVEEISRDRRHPDCIISLGIDTPAPLGHRLQPQPSTLSLSEVRLLLNTTCLLLAVVDFNPFYKRSDIPKK